METNHEMILTAMELRVRRLWSRSPGALEDAKSWLKVDLEIFGADLDKRSNIGDMLDPYELFLRFMAEGEMSGSEVAAGAVDDVYLSECELLVAFAAYSLDAARFFLSEPALQTGVKAE